MTEIAVDDLWKSYGGQNVVRGVSFALAQPALQEPPASNTGASFENILDLQGIRISGVRAPTLLWKSENVIRTHFVALGGLALAVVCSAGLGIKSDDESGFYWAVAPPQKRLNVSTMTVDGEVFEVWTPVGYPNQRNFDWLSGPNKDYGFSSGAFATGASEPVPWTKAELEREIRDFLALVDPTTGYIEDD